MESRETWQGSGEVTMNPKQYAHEAWKRCQSCQIDDETRTRTRIYNVNILRLKGSCITFNTLYVYLIYSYVHVNSIAKELIYIFLYMIICTHSGDVNQIPYLHFMVWWSKGVYIYIFIIFWINIRQHSNPVSFLLFLQCIYGHHWRSGDNLCLTSKGCFCTASENLRRLLCNKDFFSTTLLLWDTT